MEHEFVRHAESASLTNIRAALTELQKTSQEQLIGGTYESAGVARLAQNARLSTSSE
jgi:hypothetical protein